MASGGAADGATGFMFDDATPEALSGALERAVAAYSDRPAWRALMARGMAQDFSWKPAAEQYLALYRDML